MNKTFVWIPCTLVIDHMPCEHTPIFEPKTNKHAAKFVCTSCEISKGEANYKAVPPFSLFYR